MKSTIGILFLLFAVFKLGEGAGSASMWIGASVAASGVGTGKILAAVGTSGLNGGVKIGVSRVSNEEIYFFLPEGALTGTTFNFALVFEYVGYCEFTYDTSISRFGASPSCRLLTGSPGTSTNSLTSGLDWGYVTYLDGSNTYNMSFTANKKGSTCAGLYYTYGINSVGASVSLQYVSGDLDFQGALSPTATFGYYLSGTTVSIDSLVTNISPSAVAFFPAGTKKVLCGFSANPLYIDYAGSNACLEIGDVDGGTNVACSTSNAGVTLDCTSPALLFNDYTLTSSAGTSTPCI